jgi:predicted adenine nucleotide alpha hydrolase (AANH) superfamily ATPase
MKKKLLLHSCCAPCSSYVIEYLKDNFDITIYFYNPNISPEEEYLKRKEEIIKFIKNFDIPYLDCDYESEKFEKVAKGLEEEKEKGKRCHKCYHLRMEKVAVTAKKNKFDIFGTTLSVSPYKDADKLNEIGHILSEKYAIAYLEANFKKNNGYKRSIELSKIYGLYRQNYCGCIYSKKNVEAIK